MTPRRTAGPAPTALADALAAALGRPVQRLEPIVGGDLNDAYAATLAGDERSPGQRPQRVFVKTSAGAAPGAYASEAAGLRWLADAHALPLPQVLAVADTPAPPAAASPPPAAGSPPAARTSAPFAGVGAGPRFLVLSWIDAGPASSAADEQLGRGLARLHQAGAPAFGGPADTLHIGPLTLPNEPASDWPAFYAERRLTPLARLAQDRGALSQRTPRLLDRLLNRLPELAGPAEPPARVHGDLWGGNVLVDVDGRPWLIDPAAHGGHRELDLAMLRLFGGPTLRCFDAYEEEAPLSPGAEDRIALWQLAPLLLHAALFGAAYAARVEEALRRYA